MPNLKNIQNYWRYLYIDTYLFILLIILCCFGFLMLYSASAGSLSVVLKQVVNLLLALCAMLVVAQIPPYQLKRFAISLIILGVILLLLVLLVGVSSKGATRWLDLGVTRLQPSELLKIIMPITIASILSRGATPPKFKEVSFSLIIILVIIFLIYKQPDLGTALLIALSGGYILYFSGLSFSPFKKLLANIVSLFVLIFGGGYLTWHYLLHAYQKQRILTFLSPENDSLNTGYHIIQSKIAIGSGGLLGKGWMNGSQSQLDFLPEHHTDFIFAVIAEELGLMGILFLLVLYGLILHRCFVIALKSSDNFSRLLAAGLTMTFFTYIFVNIGMVSGLLPVVGVPLPLVSYGGSSYVTLMISFGIIMSIHQHKYSPLKQRE